MMSYPQVLFRRAAGAKSVKAGRRFLESALPEARQRDAGGDAPGMTYGAYLEALREALEKDGAALVREAVRTRLGDAAENSLEEIAVTPVKHGAFYHPARVDVKTGAGVCRFAANVAIAEPGLSCLAHETGVLRALEAFRPGPYAPKARGAALAEAAREDGTRQPVAVLLTDWFSGFHEFHLSGKTGAEEGLGVRIWDKGHTGRFLDPREEAELYWSMAFVLGYYYDLGTSGQVLAWHNAAGDFVVRAARGRVEARLVTARHYGPLAGGGDDAEEALFLGLMATLANGTLRLRLDRLDGVGELALAEARAVWPAVLGFFAGLARAFSETASGEPLNPFLKHLKEQTEEDWGECLEALLEACPDGSPDLPALRAGAPGHCRELGRALSRLPNTDRALNPGFFMLTKRT
jgi:hypothetical protein